MKVTLNKAELTDKILGCWVGKNIGGTIGGPYEGKKELLDITGFSSPKGEPLPNDDLDLQLVWLDAMEKVGPRHLNVNVLADYWLSFIPPHWNEYGIGKCNLNMGLLPPLSGEYNNEMWKNSNGAWIRSEIWACLAPGVPNVAVKYAIMDASIDHGLSEGTYAEIFTASLQSMAFFESDVRKLIEKALGFIPEDCRVARSVKLVLKSYDEKLPWQETRELVLEDSKDLGWFQAPGNLAFVVLGLLYGEGDFKKSLLYAVNCGDDTDCTAGTAGAILGIMYGNSGLPEDWKEYIGDKIVTICINASRTFWPPRGCNELTERVIKLIPEVMKAHEIDLEFTDGKSEVNPDEAAEVLKGHVQNIFSRSPFSFEIPSLLHTNAVVEYERAPHIKPGESFKVKVTLENTRPEPHYYEVQVCLPEGWTAEYSRTAYLSHYLIPGIGYWEMTITAGENVAPINKIPVTLSTSVHAVPVMIPIVLLG